MAKQSIRVTRSLTQVTVRVGKFYESFTTEYMTQEEVEDRIRWTLITAGVSPTVATLKALSVKEG